MALFPGRNTTSDAQDLATDEPFDVMGLRRLVDHPLLQPLTERRHQLVQRLRTLEDDHTRLEGERAHLEQSEAEQVAVLGASWSPVRLRELKEALADNESEASVLATGLELLDVALDETKAVVRDDLEMAFNHLRKPLLDTVIAALESIVEANTQLHGIEGLSQRLLGHAKYHLYDASLPHRLQLMTRTAHLLALAELGADAAAG